MNEETEKNTTIPPISVPGWKSVIIETEGKDIHLVMPERLAKFHGNPLHPDEKNFTQIQKRFDEDLEWLVKQALVGERRALEIIVRMGVDAGAYLDHISKMRPGLAADVASLVEEWPILLTPENNRPQDPVEVRDRIKLGSKMILRTDKTRFRKQEKLQRQIAFYVLRVFEQARRLDAMRKKYIVIANVLQFEKEPGAVIGAPEDHALILATARAELDRVVLSYREAETSIMVAHQTVLALLGVAPASPDPASARIDALCQWALTAKGVSADTEAEWSKKVIEYLEAILGEQLEENLKLRVLGDPSGDVEIRARCRTQSIDEFNQTKKELRHDPGVNGAIRTRIKQKMRDAVAEIIG